MKLMSSTFKEEWSGCLPPVEPGFYSLKLLTSVRGVTGLESALSTGEPSCTAVSHQTLAKANWKQAKTTFPLRKVHQFSLNVKIPSCSDITFSTTASTRVFVAAAWFTVTPCMSLPSSSWSLYCGLQQMLPALVTTKTHDGHASQRDFQPFYKCPFILFLHLHSFIHFWFVSYLCIFFFDWLISDVLDVRWCKPNSQSFDNHRFDGAGLNSGKVSGGLGVQVLSLSFSMSADLKPKVKGWTVQIQMQLLLKYLNSAKSTRLHWRQEPCFFGVLFH